jgi:hypothetical protein
VQPGFGAFDPGSSKVLKRIASETGGTYIRDYKLQDLSDHLGSVVRQLRYRIYLGYTASASEKKAHHRVEILTAGKKLRVAAASGRFDAD